MIRCLITLFLAAFASLETAADDAVSERLKAKVQQVFDDTTVTSVSPSPIKGVYEIMLGPSLIYMSEDGRYVMHGDIIDLDRRINLSDQTRALARKDVFNRLDPHDYVEFAPRKPDLKKTLYVYTDIDCTYCRKMHREIGELNKAGIAIRYLAFPRSGLEGASFKKAAAVWCSADRKKAMTAAKAGNPVYAKSCDHPVAEQFDMGQAMGVSGTPAVYTDEGEQIGGYIPAAELINMLQAGKI
ncbi:MAG: DsbC family protein [Pseudomonadota bacterium]|nr:DsbC family protein [Pseudomonadota bacterium]